MKTNSNGRWQPSRKCPQCPKWMIGLALCLAGLLAISLAAPGAWAGQAQDQGSDRGDPPSRAARLSYVEGSVSLQPGGEGDWGTAAKNRPTTVGDKIWADKDSRAELQAGQASIHMGSMTALSFLNLDDNIMQVRIAEGAINFRVRELREGDTYEVDTPNMAFTVKQAGAFRVEVSEDGVGTRVTAIRGEGEITAGGKTYEVRSGEMAELNGTDNPNYQSEQAAPPDGLDRWAAQRDLREDNSTSAKYVSRDMPGYSDLDDNGTWNEEPDYGSVWYPNSEPVGWAPYSNGYWNYIGPWGWSWIGYEPWGFAPYHYGRWSYIGSRWGWCPGPLYERPFYGPAFVGFYGGGGFGVGLNVGWFPLGFGEPCHPWWYGGRDYAERINVRNTVINNTTIINNNNFNYRYAHDVNAVTVASHGAFVNGQAINRNSIRVTPETLRGARVTNNIGFSPTRTSNFGAVNARGHIATPPSAVQNRAVVARTTPGAAASRQSVRAINTSRFTPGRPTLGSANFNNRGGSTTVNSARPAFGNNGRPGFNNNGANIGVNNGVNNNVGTARQNELSRNRPPSAGGSAGALGGGFNNNNTRAAIGRTTTSGSANTRTWEAQGNSTDRGHQPRGFASESNNRGSVTPNGNSQGARYSRSDRPAWAGTGATGNANVGGNTNGSRSTYAPGNNNSSNPNSNGSYQPPSRSNPNSNGSYQPPSRSNPNSNGSYQPPSRSNSNSNGSYQPPSRSYSNSNGSYQPPSRSNSNSNGSYQPPSRSNSNSNGSYQPPSRSYSNDSRSYQAPSRSYSAPRSSYPSSRPSYSAPSQNQGSSAPSRSYSAPTHSSGGGGTSNGGGGGNSPHGGGGGSSSHGGGRTH